jgi:hypothetical protein
LTPAGTSRQDRTSTLKPSPKAEVNFDSTPPFNPLAFGIFLIKWDFSTFFPFLRGLGKSDPDLGDGHSYPALT